jgi:hypothetical protein
VGAIDHLGRRGYKQVGKALPLGEKRFHIAGHRARKEHVCANEACPLDRHIPIDEVYVEFSVGPKEMYTGKGKRYHIHCAAEAGLIEQVLPDTTNRRRDAIALTRHNREKNASSSS